MFTLKIDYLKEFQVSEKITDILKKEFGVAETRFQMSGREDIDVRMLGDGRPFVVEMKDCKRTKSLKVSENV